ncbi:hypothetical protein [Bradyrhizobium sp. I71]|uniref:hypothetical protein n=1 Tax=Bradyrhizobium sp. I71 TaxID=2590772 RepID=UPI001EF78E35|nr:hypothetical protein [Bradyrhizobium sp. I71]ULK95986.1 hypothetical protein FJV43_24985 [Bradyrhizobium sp. I71]
MAAKIPDHIVGLFVEPVLLEGEDPKLYWNMVSAAIDEHQPASFLDWIEINDLVTKLWEERVYRRATNAVIWAGQRTAVEQFVTEIIPGDGRLKSVNMAAREANNYFSASKQEREEVRSQLATYKIGEAEVLARSAQNNSDAIKMLEGMVSSRECTRRKLQKEMRRRRSSQGVKSETCGDANSHHPSPHGSCQRGETTGNVDFDVHHRGEAGASRKLTATMNEEVDLHPMSQSRSCRGVKAEVDLDGGQHNLDRLGSCQEAKAKIVGERDIRNHGH